MRSIDSDGNRAVRVIVTDGVTLSGSSATLAAAVTPNDAGDLDATRGVYIGGAGNVVVDLYDAATGTTSTVTFSGVPAGTILPVVVTRVYATNTTATSIVALY